MRALESACELAEAQQVPPLRYAPVGMTNFLQETASKAVGWRVVHGPTELSSRPERTRISCHAALDMAACAAFRKESRMKFANATKFDRRSGVA